MRNEWRSHFPSFRDPAIGNRLSPTPARLAYFKRRHRGEDDGSLPKLLRQMIRDGYDRQGLAQELGCHPQTVSAICRDYQIAPPQPHPDAFKNNGRKPKEQKR